MPRADPLQENFSVGEVSPFVKGRATSDAYKAGVDYLENYLPIPQGPITRRTGTEHVDFVKGNGVADARLVAFSVTKTDSYMLEFSNNNVRIYKNRAIVGGPVDVATDILISEVWDLKFVQKGDTLFMVHPLHQPHILVRVSDTVWTFSTITNIPANIGPHIDGPYLQSNTLDDGSVDTTAVFTPSATTGTINITTGAFTPFTLGWEPTPTHLGRLIRLFHSGNAWTYARTRAFISSSSINVDILGPDLPDLLGMSLWAFGSYSEESGYPSSIAIHQERLVLGKEQTLDFSKTGELNKFNPSENDGTITDAHAITETLAGKEVNVINRLDSDENGLLVGTEGADWLVRPIEAQTFAQGNLRVNKFSSLGNADEEALNIGKSYISLGITRTKFREAKFVDNSGGFTVRDIGLLGDHLLRPRDEGLFSMVRLGYVDRSGVSNAPAHQQNPYSRIWITLTNGELRTALTSDQEEIEFGPSRIVLGGVGDQAGGPPAVMSVATLPSPDGSVSDVWLVVRRYVNGNYLNSVEVITQEFDNRVPLEEGNFLDASRSNNNPVHVSNITNASPAVVTTTAPHGYFTGAKINFYDIQGMVGSPTLKGSTQTITVLTPTTFEIDGFDTSGYTLFAPGGSATIGGVNLIRILITSMTILGHLEGEMVQVVGDGKVQKDQLVVGGAIILETPAAIVHAGFKYNSDVRFLRFDRGSAVGSSFIKTQRTDRVNVLVERVVNMKIGQDFDKLYETRIGKTDEFTGVVTSLTGIGYELGNQLCIRQDTPLPGTVLAVMPKLITQDR